MRLYVLPLIKVPIFLVSFPVYYVTELHTNESKSEESKSECLHGVSVKRQLSRRMREARSERRPSPGQSNSALADTWARDLTRIKPGYTATGFQGSPLSAYQQRQNKGSTSFLHISISDSHILRVGNGLFGMLMVYKDEVAR